MTASELGRTVKTFTRELASALQRQTSIEPAWAGDLAPFLVDLQTLDIEDTLTPRARRHSDHPALTHLERALDLTAQSGPAPLPALCRTLSDSVSWCLSYANEGWGAQVADRMVACHVVGPAGFQKHDSLAFGLLLLSPELYYPLHGHKAAEVYFVLGGGADFYYGSENAEPLSRGPGQICVTRTATPHAIENGIEPSLVLYVWRGAVLEPTWSLEPGPDGGLVRHYPAKRPIL